MQGCIVGWKRIAVSTPLTSEHNTSKPNRTHNWHIWSHLAYTRSNTLNWWIRCKTARLNSNTVDIDFCLPVRAGARLLFTVISVSISRCICQSQMLKRWLWKVAMGTVACRGSQTALGSRGQCRDRGQQSRAQPEDRQKQKQVNTKRFHAQHQTTA